MDTGIHIGNNVVPGGFKGLAKSIVRILEVSYATHADQATTQLALKSFNEATRVTNTSVSGCTINGSGDTWEFTPDDIEDDGEGDSP
jgi:hypothetical protein